MMKTILKFGIPVVILLLIIGFMSKGEGHGNRSRFPSSFAPEPEGLLAFHRLLLELEIPTKRLTQGLEFWASDNPEGVLIIATPLRRPFRTPELDVLNRWVERGGRLLIYYDATVAEEVPILEAWLDSLGIGVVPPVTEPNPLTFLPSRPPLADSRATHALGLNPPPKKVRLHQDGRLDELYRGIPLALDAKGSATAAMITHGQGTVAVVMGSPLATDQIKNDQNLIFGLSLVEKLRQSDTVYFDEFHQGYGTIFNRTEYWQKLPITLLLVVFIATFTVYALARGIPFGPLKPLPEPRRRRGIEFSRSMAVLYRRSKNSTHVLNVFIDQCIHSWKRFGISKQQWASGDAFQRVAREQQLPVDEVKSIWERAQQHAERKQIPERSLIKLTKDLTRITKENL